MATKPMLQNECASVHKHLIGGDSVINFCYLGETGAIDDTERASFRVLGWTGGCV